MAGVYNENEYHAEDSLGSLYEGHEVDDEVVIGPVEIWKPIILKFVVPTSKNTEPVKKKEDKKSYSCEVCKTENTMHYTCARCDKQFGRRMAMIAHLRKHMGSLENDTQSKNICQVGNHLTFRGHSSDRKAYQTFCEAICHKEFKSCANLKIHMIKHSKLRPFICNICNKGYKREETLMTHKLIHEEKRPFKCEHCSKSFKVKSQLQVHARLHTGQKPYKCNICLRQFTQKTSLNNHLLKHKGVKPHHCEFCLEQFRQISNLKQHLANKHPDEKVFQSDSKKVIQYGVQTVQSRHVDDNVQVLTWHFCEKCNKMFSRDDLKKHRKLCHSGEYT